MYAKFLCINWVKEGSLNTERFNIEAPKFLITSPKKTAKKIYQSIKNKKEIVYIGFLWRIILLILNLIPEKNFKKLKF